MINELVKKCELECADLFKKIEETESYFSALVLNAFREEKIRKRGISITCFAVESVTLAEESERKIDDYELSSNAHMQQGRLVDAYAEAIQNAASNKSGTMNGFMGIGMMNMATNGMMGGVATNPWQNTKNSQIDLSKENQNSEEDVMKKEEAKDESSKVEQNEEWKCECGNVNKGKFCSNCGKPKSNKKKCTKCGAENEATDKFCSECGTKLE